MSANMRKYRLKPGVGKHHVFGEIYKPGDVIVLNEESAEKIKDKIEPLKASEPEKQEETVATKAAAPPPAETVVGEAVAVDDASPTNKEPDDSKPTLVIQQTEGGFNVLNVDTLTILNTVPLTKEEAEQLVGQR